MTKIAIITSTSLPQGDMVFRGVYGRLTQLPKTHEGDDPKHTFSVAPELRPVSTVFQYLDNGSTPVQLGEFQTVDVPEADVDRVQDQLMYALQKRWRGMYKSLAPSVDGMVSTLLAGDARVVENAVNTHFAARNKSLWSVPVTATMKTGSDGAYLTTEQALLEALPSHSAESINVSDEAPTPYVEAAAEITLPAPIADPEAAAPAWADYMGVEAQIKGHMVVVAASEQDAVMAANALLAAGKGEDGSGMKFVPAIVPTAVLATRALQYTDAVRDADDAQDDDDGDDGDDSDSPRDHYRF